MRRKRCERRPPENTSHMQNRPSQVRSWTGASWRMVCGISRIDVKISLALAGETGLLASSSRKCLQVVGRIFLGREDRPENCAEESGGADIEGDVDRCSRNDPCLAPRCGDVKHSWSSSHGKRRCDHRSETDEEALHGEAAVRCCSGSRSATKARNGSMLILMEASSIQSRPAAIQSAELRRHEDKRERTENRAGEEVRATAPEAVPRCDRWRVR